MEPIPRRQLHPKLTPVCPKSHPSQNKVDRSNIFLYNRPNIAVPTPTNARPPTANPKMDRPAQNNYLVRVKISSNRVIKSKTDHSGDIDASEEKTIKQKYNHRILRPAKSQSVHRSSSVRSFLIRKKNVSSSGKRTQKLSTNDQRAQLHSLQKKLMQQINQNSMELENRLQTIVKEDKQCLIKETSSEQKSKKQQKAQGKVRFDLQTTLVSQLCQRNNALELLETKKSYNYSKNDLNQYQVNQNISKNEQRSQKRYCQKQNFNRFRQNCNKYQSSTQNLVNNYNKYLRKQDKHKSNKQFDRKEKVHSACRIIKVPWNQLQILPSNEHQNEKLKKSRGELKRSGDLYKKSQLFGGISMIAGNAIKVQGSYQTDVQSLRDLWKELQFKEGLNVRE